MGAARLLPPVLAPAAKMIPLAQTASLPKQTPALTVAFHRPTAHAKAAFNLPGRIANIPIFIHAVGLESRWPAVCAKTVWKGLLGRSANIPTASLVGKTGPFKKMAPVSANLALIRQRFAARAPPTLLMLDLHRAPHARDICMQGPSQLATSRRARRMRSTKLILRSPPAVVSLASRATGANASALGVGVRVSSAVATTLAVTSTHCSRANALWLAETRVFRQ